MHTTFLKVTVSLFTIVLGVGFWGVGFVVVVFAWEGISSNAQDILLSLCSVIMPSIDQRLI